MQLPLEALNALSRGSYAWKTLAHLTLPCFETEKYSRTEFWKIGKESSQERQFVPCRDIKRILRLSFVSYVDGHIGSTGQAFKTRTEREMPPLAFSKADLEDPDYGTKKTGAKSSAYRGVTLFRPTMKWRAQVRDFLCHAVTVNV